MASEIHHSFLCRSPRRTTEIATYPRRFTTLLNGADNVITSFVLCSAGAVKSNGAREVTACACLVATFFNRTRCVRADDIAGIVFLHMPARTVEIVAQASLVTTLLQRTNGSTACNTHRISFSEVCEWTSIVGTLSSQIATIAVCATRGSACDVCGVEFADEADGAGVVCAVPCLVTTLCIRARRRHTRGIPQTNLLHVALRTRVGGARSDWITTLWFGTGRTRTSLVFEANLGDRSQGTRVGVANREGITTLHRGAIDFETINAGGVNLVDVKWRAFKILTYTDFIAALSWCASRSCTRDIPDVTDVGVPEWARITAANTPHHGQLSCVAICRQEAQRFVGATRSARQGKQPTVIPTQSGLVFDMLNAADVD